MGYYLHLQTQFGEDRCMQFRVIVVKVPTHKQTHRQDRLQYTAAMISAHCNDTGIMPHRGTLSDDARLTSVCLTSVCLPVAYIGPKSRTERPRKTKYWHRGSPRHTWLGHHFQGQGLSVTVWGGDILWRPRSCTARLSIAICGVHMAESLLTGLVFTIHCVCGL